MKKKILYFILLLVFAVAGLFTMQYFSESVDPDAFQGALTAPLSSFNTK